MQGDSGLGLEAQRAAVIGFLGVNQPMAEYTEIESGKRHLNRPQLMAALEHCKKHKATLVIAKLDRLARNTHFITGLLDAGVKFVAADNPSADRTMLEVYAVFASHEARVISQRTKAALQAAKSRGARLGNPRWDESLHLARLAKNPVRPAEQVVQMMRERRNEGATFRQVAEFLNSLGVRTPKGSQWYASTVRACIHADQDQLAA